MPRCIRLAAIWLFVLAFQLFQEPSASTYMCRHKRHKEVISVEDAGYNCKTMKVKLGMCVGTCNSYAIPIPLEGDDNEPRFQTGCECCAPKDLKERTIRFGDGCEKSIVISQIRSCECKNCSRRDLWELRNDSTISRNLAYGWRCSSCKMAESLFKEDRLYVYITITNTNCLINCTNDVIRKLKRVSMCVRESSRSISCFYY